MESQFQQYQEGPDLPKQVSMADFKLKWTDSVPNSKLWKRANQETHRYLEKKKAVDGAHL